MSQQRRKLSISTKVRQFFYKQLIDQMKKYFRVEDGPRAKPRLLLLLQKEDHSQQLQNMDYNRRFMLDIY